MHVTVKSVVTVSMILLTITDNLLTPFLVKYTLQWCKVNAYFGIVDISIKELFIVMSCKSILLLSFLLPCNSNMMNTISNKNDNHTQHTRPNYPLHCRSVDPRITQEI